MIHTPARQPARVLLLQCKVCVDSMEWVGWGGWGGWGGGTGIFASGHACFCSSPTRVIARKGCVASAFVRVRSTYRWSTSLNSQPRLIPNLIATPEARGICGVSHACTDNDQQALWRWGQVGVIQAEGYALRPPYLQHSSIIPPPECA
jgi:hypothetical protein